MKKKKAKKTIKFTVGQGKFEFTATMTKEDVNKWLEDYGVFFDDASKELILKAFCEAKVKGVGKNG